MSMDLTEAVEAAKYRVVVSMPLGRRAIIEEAIKTAAPIIEAEIRESIAAEFDRLAALLTAAIERTTDANARSTYQDRRAQMATAAQMVRGGGTDRTEPQPGDGPEYHADHAFWAEHRTRKVTP